MAGDNSVYDAFSTLELLKEVLNRYNDYKEELAPRLNDIKENMEKASEVPLTGSNRPITSSKTMTIVE